MREALGLLVAEGLATREPHRGVRVARPRGRLGARRLRRARWVLEGAGVRRWREATEAQRDHVRASLSAYTDAVRAGGSYQELNERHLAFHVSLVGLTGSPRLVAMAENLVVELKLALAQVERIAPQRPRPGRLPHRARRSCSRTTTSTAAHDVPRRHLADAEVEIIEALGL